MHIFKILVLILLKKYLILICSCVSVEFSVLTNRKSARPNTYTFFFFCPIDFSYIQQILDYRIQKV